MSASEYLWCVVGGAILGLVVYYWPERKPKAPPAQQRESAGIATDGSDADSAREDEQC